MSVTHLALAFVSLLASGVASAGDSTVRDAVAQAVAERMGAGADVTVERLDARVTPPMPAALRAVPPPGARTGRLVSFALFDGSKRVGTATALVKVSVPHVRAIGSVARDTVVKAADVALVRSELDGARFGRVPDLSEIVGALVRRDVAAGEPLTHALVEIAPAVRSGDEVEVVSRIGVVEARGTGRASGSGHVGARIRVSSGSKKTLRPARVVSAGVVELLGPGERTQGEHR